MDPSDFAQDELDEWQAALDEQHEAERHLQRARAAGDHAQIALWLGRLQTLRLRADLKLAEAVRLKCSYRESLWSKLNPLR